MNENTFGVLL